MSELPEITRLLADVRSSAPGAMDVEMRGQLFAVLRDFCDETNVWQETIDVNVTVGNTAYVITPTLGSIIRLLNFYNPQDTYKRFATPATMQVPGALVLQQSPSQDVLLTALVSKTVDDPVDAEGNPPIDSWIVQKYSEAFTAGVVGRLLRQPAKPYTDKELAMYHLKTYRSMRSTARVEVLHQNLYGAQTWLYPQAFAPGRRTSRV